MKEKIFTSLLALITSVSVCAQTWVSQDPGMANSSYSISDISISDADQVWVYSNATKGFSKTSNGGATWSSGIFNDIITDYGSMYNFLVSDISGVDHMTAWVMTLHGSNMYDVWKTSNGGSTWTKQLNLAPATGKFVHFFDANTGIVVADPTGGSATGYKFNIYRTVDGGATWNLIVDSPDTPGGVGTMKHCVVGNDVFFWEEHPTGFLGGSSYTIYKSADKGLTWSTLPASFSGSDRNLMAWSDVNKGIVVEQTVFTLSQMVMRRTNDGGATWSNVSFTGLPLSWIEDISYVPGTNILVAVGQNSLNIPDNLGSWISKDNGSTWTAIDPGVYHSTVKCYNGGVCYSGGMIMSVNKSLMYKMSLVQLGTEEIKAKQVGIYPNPTKGELNIQSEKKIKLAVVLDVSGRILTRVDSPKIDMSSFSKGIYILHIQFADGTYSSEKIVKE